MASWAVSFVSVLSSRAREKATKVELLAFSESCTLLDISMRQRTLRDERLTLESRTFLWTDIIHHSNETPFNEIPIWEWLYFASKETGDFITGMCHFVSVCSLHLEKRSCFFQVLIMFKDGVLPLGNRHGCQMGCPVFSFLVAANVEQFEHSHSFQTYKALCLPKSLN